MANSNCQDCKNRTDCKGREAHERLSELASGYINCSGYEKEEAYDRVNQNSFLYQRFTKAE